MARTIAASGFRSTRRESELKAPDLSSVHDGSCPFGNPAIRDAEGGRETVPTCGKLSGKDEKEADMSDFRDPLYRDPNDPMSGNVGYEPAGRNAGWGWIAAAVFLVVILAIAFGVGHSSNDRVAMNNASTPPAAMTHPPGAAPLAPSPTPGLTPPPAPTPTEPNR